MNIGIIGVGGVGGYIGGRLSVLLEHRKDINLYFIARGAHLEEIRKNGLLLDSPDEKLVCRPTLVTDDFSRLPELDICFLTVKGYELENVCINLRSRIKENGLIIPLLNGADITDRIRRNLDKGIVLPACIYIISFIEKPGRVHQDSTSPLIHIGSGNGRDSAEQSGATELLQFFDYAGISYKWHDDPRPEIWRKFLFIAPFSLVSANYNVTTGEIMESAGLGASVKKIISEIYGIARSMGIALAEDVCEKAFSLGHKFDYDSTTSFQRDYRIKSKPDERDIFGAAVIRMGEETGTATPETLRIYREIESKKPPV